MLKQVHIQKIVIEIVIGHYTVFVPYADRHAKTVKITAFVTYPIRFERIFRKYNYTCVAVEVADNCFVEIGSV